MRRIIALLLLLWGVGWVASQLPATTNARPQQANSWRRTSDGWERANWLDSHLLRPQPALHPAAVGLVLLLFALAALIGLAPDEDRAIRGRQVSASTAPSPPRNIDPSPRE